MNSNADILSKWVQMEIDFATEKSKPMYCLNIIDGDSPFESIRFEQKDGVLFISEEEAKKIIYENTLSIK